MSKAIVHLLHDPLVLRVDEMVEGALGIMTAKQVGEIPLQRGRNEVDADMWRRWLADNAGNPLVTNGTITEEKVQEKQETPDDEAKAG